jgi:succinyl-CoA synthetase beta subunit
MKLYENEAKLIFDKNKIQIPRNFGVITSLEEIPDMKLSFPVIMKAMVLIGGRGKAGGVKKANSIEEVESIAKELFKLRIKSFPVKKILIEEVLAIKHEIYAAVTTDPATFDVVFITSASGGVEIEEVAKITPEKIFSKKILENDRVLPVEIANEAKNFINDELGIKSDIGLSKVFSNLYSTFQDIDGKLCEINPLIITEDQKIIAADAKIVLDDNSLYRQDKLLRFIGFDPKSKRHDVSEQTKFEARAYQNSFPYVDLLDYETVEKDPSKLYVGLVPGGAGYGIFSIDEVVNVGNRFYDSKVIPINFMDSGGGPPVHRVAEMFHLLMDHPLPDLIITSRFGGISSCDVFIRGLVLALRDRYAKKERMIPVFGRMVGTELPAAREYYEKAKLETPEPLANLYLTIGNQKIMVDVIKDGLEYGFNWKTKGGDI